jgi:hypothetical protein
MAYVSATAAQVANWAGLNASTAIPEVLTDMRQDPDRTSLLAQGILSVLTSEPKAQTKAE